MIGNWELISRLVLAALPGTSSPHVKLLTRLRFDLCVVFASCIVGESHASTWRRDSGMRQWVLEPENEDVAQWP